MIKKVLLWILGIAVTLIVIGGGVAVFALHNTTSKIHSMDSSLSKRPLVSQFPTSCWELTPVH
nr:hypothetical protein [Weissella cibaria]